MFKGTSTSFVSLYENIRKLLNCGLLQGMKSCMAQSLKRQFSVSLELKVIKEKVFNNTTTVSHLQLCFNCLHAVQIFCERIYMIAITMKGEF